MEPRQEARQLLRPLFDRPLTPEQRRVCDNLTALLITRNLDIGKMQQKIDEQSDQIDTLEDELQQARS